MHQHICILKSRARAKHENHFSKILLEETAIEPLQGVRVQGSCNDERMSKEETLEAIIQRIEFFVSKTLNENILKENQNIFDHISIKNENEDMKTHDLLEHRRKSSTRRISTAILFIR